MATAMRSLAHSSCPEKTGPDFSRKKVSLMSFWPFQHYQCKQGMAVSATRRAAASLALIGGNIGSHLGWVARLDRWHCRGNRFRDRTRMAAAWEEGADLEGHVLWAERAGGKRHAANRKFRRTACDSAVAASRGGPRLRNDAAAKNSRRAATGRHRASQLVDGGSQRQSTQCRQRIVRRAQPLISSVIF